MIPRLQPAIYEIEPRLSRDEATLWLLRLVDTKAAMDEQWDALRVLVGADTETPFGIIFWRTLDLLIEAVGDLLDDQVASINWFLWYDDCGAKVYEHSLPDGSMRAVTNIEDLLDVLGFE